jgi:hypothetical protein
MRIIAILRGFQRGSLTLAIDSIATRYFRSPASAGTFQLKTAPDMGKTPKATVEIETQIRKLRTSTSQHF